MGLFDVIQTFRDGASETVREKVSAVEAMKAAKHYCTSIAAQCGFVSRVVIVCDGDTLAFEWLYGQGVTFPRPKDIPGWMQ